MKDTFSLTCVITGGSSGIGLAAARKFYQAGYQIAVCGRSSQKLAAAEHWIREPTAHRAEGDRGGIFVHQVDLADTGAAQRFTEQAIADLGRVDVLVNNAAAAPLAPFETVTEDQFENLVDINIRANFYITQKIWQQMVSSGHGGTIVNISSQAAVDPFEGFSLYGASKAWLDLMTQSLVDEGEKHAIRMCSLRPGAVETPLLRGLFPDFPKEQCVLPETVADRIWDCVNDPQRFPSGQCFDVTIE